MLFRGQGPAPFKGEGQVILVRSRNKILNFDAFLEFCHEIRAWIQNEFHNSQTFPSKIRISIADNYIPSVKGTRVQT
jgi:hypothetical protein